MKFMSLLAQTSMKVFIDVVEHKKPEDIFLDFSYVKGCSWNSDIHEGDMELANDLIAYARLEELNVTTDPKVFYDVVIQLGYQGSYKLVYGGAVLKMPADTVQSIEQLLKIVNGL